jgi:hypothetical protein
MELPWVGPGRWRRAAQAILLTVLLASCATGCRSSEPKTFQGRNATFSYPDSWARVDGRGFNMPPSSPIWAVSVGVDGMNSVTVAAYRVNALVTEENLDKLKRSIIDNVRSIVDRSGSEVVGDATETDLDGLPALRFEVADKAGRAKSNLYVAYRENTEYFLNCTYTVHGEEVRDGCAQVVDSIDLPS